MILGRIFADKFGFSRYLLPNRKFIKDIQLFLLWLSLVIYFTERYLPQQILWSILSVQFKGAERCWKDYSLNTFPRILHFYFNIVEKFMVQRATILWNTCNTFGVGLRFIFWKTFHSKTIWGTKNMSFLMCNWFLEN